MPVGIRVPYLIKYRAFRPFGTSNRVFQRSIFLGQIEREDPWYEGDLPPAWWSLSQTPKSVFVKVGCWHNRSTLRDPLT